MDITRKEKNTEKVIIEINALGTYFWNDGSKFTGDWLDNKISGFVIFELILIGKIYMVGWKRI